MGIARKSVFGFGGQVYMLVVGLVSTIIIARLLGPEGKGVLAVVAAVPSLALGAASFGLGPALAFMAGKNRYPARELLTAALLWSVLLGLVVGTIVWLARVPLLASVLKGLTAQDLAVVLVSLPAYYLNAFIGALLAGHGRAVAVAGLSAVGATLNLAAVVGASLWFPRESSAMVIALSVAAFVGAIVALAVCRVGLAFSPMKLYRITRESTPYAAKSYIGQATSMFFLRADVFFLNYFAGPAAVGVYSVATNLAEKLWMLSNPVSTAVYSLITGAERDDAVRLTTLTSRTLLVLNGVAGLLLVGAAVLLVPVIYGSQFTGAIWYLTLLLPGVIVYAVCQPYSQFFSGQLGKPGITSNLSALMMILSAGLYMTLIPKMGATGAALGSTISYSSALLGYAWLMPRASGVTLREMLIPSREDFELYKSVGVSVLRRLRRNARHH
ncbi:MAG: oligosaccharide flippase family protein [Actinomycetota bacterium]|nr:oligosaccharide flippase family protein [Actinomycetota bacterium]